MAASGRSCSVTVAAWRWQHVQLAEGAWVEDQQLAINAEVITFAVTRPRRMTLNEILVRPTAQS